MKPKILLFVLPFVTAQTIAQDSSFQLKNYKYRTPGFRALTVDIAFSGSTFKYASQKNAQDSTAKSSGISLLPSNIQYSRFVSTDKKWQTLYINYYSSLYTNKGERKNAQNKSNNIHQSLYLDWTNRFYKKNIFIQIGNSLYTTFQNRKYIDLNLHKCQSIQLNNQLTLGVGKGRIEWVQDAQMALFILNDLQSKGLLQGPVSAQTQLELAQLITNINNKRIFDARRRRIYELTQIDSFLKSSQLVKETNIGHFTTINDNWTLAFNPFRKAGRVFYIHLTPTYSIKDRQTQIQNPSLSSIDYNANSFSTGPTIGYENYKPINLYWQRNAGLILSGRKTWNKEESNFSGSNPVPGNKIKQEEKQANLNAFYGLNYYPNNRTLLEAQLSTQINYSLTQDQIGNIIYINPQLSVSANYFLSYNTRLTGSIGLSHENYRISYKNGISNKAQWFSSNISFGLSHVFF